MRGSHRRVEEEVAAGDGAQHGGVDALQHHRVAQLVAQVLHALELPLEGADLLARVFVAFVSKPERAVLLLQGSDPRAQGADGLRPLHDGPAERSARSRGPAHMRVHLHRAESGTARPRNVDVKSGCVDAAFVLHPTPPILT